MTANSFGRKALLVLVIGLSALISFVTARSLSRGFLDIHYNTVGEGLVEIAWLRSAGDPAPRRLVSSTKTGEHHLHIPVLNAPIFGGELSVGPNSPSLILHQVVVRSRFGRLLWSLNTDQGLPPDGNASATVLKQGDKLFLQNPQYSWPSVWPRVLTEILLSYLVVQILLLLAVRWAAKRIPPLAIIKEHFQAHLKKWQTERGRIIFLDYLRIFAFINVLIGHKFYSYFVNWSDKADRSTPPEISTNPLLCLFYGGGAGVIVFFLVSGYIITYSLRQNKGITDFLIRRVFRIYPLYIFAVLIQYMLLSLAGRAPAPLVLLAQLSLIGDLWSAPYALNGVEWTLRVEVMFYLFMAVAYSVALRFKSIKILPFVFLVAIAACGLAHPIPSGAPLAVGYFTIYFPFLLLGSMLYLAEIKEVRAYLTILCAIAVFAHYYWHISKYYHDMLETHFAIWALLIFSTFWWYRFRLAAPPVIRAVSDMTYSVYLFHNWLFDDIKTVLSWLHISVINPDIQALAVLLLVCYVVMWFVEQPGSRLGAWVVKRIRSPCLG